MALITGYCVVAHGNIILGSLANFLAGLFVDVLNMITNKTDYLDIGMSVGLLFAYFFDYGKNEIYFCDEKSLELNKRICYIVFEINFSIEKNLMEGIYEI